MVRLLIIFECLFFLVGGCLSPLDVGPIPFKPGLVVSGLLTNEMGEHSIELSKSSSTNGPESNSVYNVDGVPVADFSYRNEFCIPDYHRLDLALIIEGNHHKKKLLDGPWAISFDNVYARKNPYSAFFKDDGNGYLKPYTLSVIAKVIPSINYSFKF